ncbi:anti-sigma factor [Marinobacter sp. KM021]|uniref:anti-sigma factor n=1 Tax=Marinobacter sp. KM021 TaxID=3075616 RepID=UPI003D6BFE55
MSEHDDLDMMVAEFVLGTLPEKERDALQARRAREPELEALIQRWEARLAGMLDGVEPVAPGPELFARIQQTIEQHTAQQRAAQEVQRAAPDNVVSLRKQLTRWRWSTAIASAAALVLVAVLATQPEPDTQAQSFVAVFQHNDEQPAFLLTVDLNSRQLNIQPVTAEPQADKSYQLWMVAEEYGPNPRSVGVIGENFTLDQAALRDYDPETLRGATFGISLEPKGGSPTGQPTGPAIHGFLYPTSADQGKGRN